MFENNFFWSIKPYIKKKCLVDFYVKIYRIKFYCKYAIYRPEGIPFLHIQ